MADTVIATYGSYTLPELVRKFKFVISYRSVMFSCNFLVTGATQSAFIAATESCESALRKVHQDFSLQFGDTASYSYKQSDNTGFNSEPDLRIVPNDVHTGLSREYQWTVKLQLPADLSGENYIRDTTIVLDDDEIQRDRLTVRGIVTAHDSVDAYSSYTANAVPWANSIALSVFGSGNYEEMKSRPMWDRENKILNFSVVYYRKLDIAVEYNSYSIPNSFSSYSFSENYGQMQFSCKFKVANASASTAEVALRQPNKDLSVTIGSLTYSYSHSSNTGMLGQPSLEKISDKTNDLDYTHYRFSISMQLPADESGKNYRKVGNYSVTWSPNALRSMEFSGVYTAGSSNSSYTNATTYAETWALNVITSILGVVNYEQTSKSYSTDDESKLTTFRITYRELASQDTASAWNDTRIVQAQSDYSVNIAQEIGKEQTSKIDALPPIRVAYNYTCWISKDVVATDAALSAVYEDTIRPWLIQQIANISGVGNYYQGGTNNLIIEDESKDISPTNYQIRGRMVCLAPGSADQIIMFSEIITTDDSTGLIDNKIYNGKDYGRSIWYDGAEREVKRTVTVTKIGSPQLDPPPLEPQDRYFLRNRVIADFQFFKGIGNPVNGVVSSPVYQIAFNENYVYAEPSTNVQTGSIS